VTTTFFRPIALRVEGYKRITVAEAHFDPDTGGVVVVSGENEQGKSSFLDAYEALIAGRNAPKVKRPINTSSKQARIIGTFRGDDGVVIVVERVYRENGTTAITVRQDGLRVEKAETILSRFYSHIAIDPHGFARLPSKEQVDTLVKLTGFDPEPLDTEHRNVFATRTEVGQTIKRLTGTLESYGDEHTDLEPAIDVAATSAQLQEAHAQLRAADNMEQERVLAEDLVSRREAEVARLQAELITAGHALETARDVMGVAQIAARNAPRPDVAPLQAKLASAEAHNALVRDQEARQRVADELAGEVAKREALTQRLAGIAKRKADGFAGVEMPVEGLTIEDGEVVLNGTPFSQTSPGGRLRTSVLIAMALNPDLRAIIIRDGALLDKANRKIIADVATERDYMVLMELVGTDDESGIVFEDGKIVSPEVTS
jgi:predicted ATPase